tara:strand:- start:2608 stop:3729 length:1122 start_codon:yes stop_codon:yes gene_type:complete
MKQKVLISQRVPAFFRKPFFEYLAKEVDLVVTSGEPIEKDSIKTFNCLSNGQFVKTEIIYCFGGKFWFDKNWKKNIETHRPDVVVLTPTPRMLSNYLVVKYCKKHSIRVVGWGMGKMPGMRRFQALVHQLLAKTLVKKLDGMICYSTAARDYYVTTGMPKEKCKIAYNSTDTLESEILFNKLRYEKELRERINNQYGLDSETFKVLFVGRLTRSKQVDALISALECFEPKVELIVVGDGVHLNALKELSSLMSYKVVFTGHKIGEELAELFLASDVFVLPSLGGLAIHQAMSFGLPVIVSVGDGTERDLIDEGVNGFVFREKDWSHLKECINVALMDKEQLKVMGRNSLLKVTRDVNINNMVCLFIGALTEND